MANLLNGLLGYPVADVQVQYPNSGGILGIQRVSDKGVPDGLMSDIYQQYMENKFSDKDPLALAYTSQASNLASEVLRRAQSGDQAAASFMEHYKNLIPGGDPRWTMMHDFRTFLTEYDREGLTGSKLPSGEDAAETIQDIGRFDQVGRPRPPFEVLFQGRNPMRMPPSPMRQYMSK